MKFFRKTTERKVNIAEKDVRQQTDTRPRICCYRKETVTGMKETNTKKRSRLNDKK
jgi:hypothetical protein